MKKVTITIEGKKYDISLENKFAEKIEEDILKDFSPTQSSDTKALLSAYLKKCFEYYTLLENIKDIYEKIKQK